MKKDTKGEQEETADDRKMSAYLSYIESADVRMSSMTGSTLPISCLIGPIWWPPLPPLPLPLDGGLWPWCYWPGIAKGPSCAFDRDGWNYRDGNQLIPGPGDNPEPDLKWSYKHVIPDDFTAPCGGAFIFEYNENFNNTKGVAELKQSGKLGSYISDFLKIINVNALAKLEEIDPCIDPCHAVGTIIGHRFWQHDGTLQTLTQVSVVCTE